MAFIDHTYFNGELNIPDTGKEEVLEQLTWFIDKYEPELLQALLGVELYDAFKAGIAAQTPEQKWLDLRDGKTYTDDSGRQRKWQGIRSTSGEQAYNYRQSLIAGYVYYRYMRRNATKTTPTGEVVIKGEGSIPISARFKVTRAWNEMVEIIWCDLVPFLDKHKDVYTGWETQRWFVRNQFSTINPFL